MPLALDLISALVMGSTLPVATTFLSMVSRFTSPSLDLSMVVLPSTAHPTNMRMAITRPIPPPIMKTRLRRLFLPLPLAIVRLLKVSIRAVGGRELLTKGYTRPAV